MLACSLTGQELRVVHNRVGSPTYAPDLNDGLRRLVQAGAKGLYHVVNAGTANSYELARAAVERARLPGPALHHRRPVPGSGGSPRLQRPGHQPL